MCQTVKDMGNEIEPEDKKNLLAKKIQNSIDEVTEKKGKIKLTRIFISTDRVREGIKKTAKKRN